MRRVSSPLNPTGFPRFNGSIRYTLFVSNLLSAGNGVGLLLFTAECNSTTTCSGCSSISSATVKDCSISCTEPSHVIILPVASEGRSETNWLPISERKISACLDFRQFCCSTKYTRQLQRRNKKRILPGNGGWTQKKVGIDNPKTLIMWL